MLRRMALCGALLLLGAPDSRSAVLHFDGPPALYNTGHEVRDVAVGDFDGDGRQDAVAAVESGIVFFRGSGDGTLSVPVEIASTPQGRLLAVDLEPDGRTDLIAWSGSSNVIRVFRGSTSGLAADTSYALGSEVFDLRVGDLNADGALDLLASEEYRVEVLLGTTGGRFDLPRSAAVFRAPGGSLALADLNRDGRLDLACYAKYKQRYGTLITIAFGFGTGGFNTPHQSSNNTLVPGPLLAADVTGDGNLDLVYTGDDVSGPDVLHVLKVQPGAFGPAVTTVTAGSVSRMMTRDLDHDGKADLLLASGVQVSSLMGNGDGSFTPGETAVMPAAVAGFALADLDGDGIEDLVAGTSAGSGRDNVAMLKGRIGQAPVARCQDVVVEAGPGCVAQATIDDGSSDPEGDPIAVVQSPAGPYPLGVSQVTLTCKDGFGNTSTCAATVTVVDCTFDAGVAASPGRGLIGIRYSIPHAGHVRVSIYDVTGHRVARPVDGPQAAGWHQASFPGGDASQVLFYRVEWDGRSLSGRIPFLR